MNTTRKECEISDEDLRAALKEMKTYVDVTEEDLKTIYAIALRHAEERLASKVAVREIMTQRVITAKKDSDIQEVSVLLSEHRISGMPVVDAGNHVIGVVSEADILAATGLGKKRSFKEILKHILGESPPKPAGEIRMGDIMVSPAITTTPETDIREVAGIMENERIKRLPVVDDENRLMGIVTRADIVRAISKR